MKFVSFISCDDDCKFGHGFLEGEKIIETEYPFYPGDIKKTGRVLDLSRVKLQSPVMPSKALCVGLNYRDHIEEMKDKVPEKPVIFIKPSSALISPENGIIYPPMVKRLDYEAELCVVIKKYCHNVEEENADEYIMGYTIANDVTARDLQDPHGQWSICKGFDTFMPIGPYVSDEVDPDNLEIESRVNGVVKQHSNTKNLIFKPRFLVSYLSKVFTLRPGDVILTGTPSGVSGMQVGDVCEIEIEGLGILRNRVIAPYFA